MNRSRVNLSLLVSGIILACAIALAVSLFAVTSKERKAIGGLNQVGVAAIQRRGIDDCMPSFSFDIHGPKIVEELIGHSYYGRVTDVWFRASDDQQVLESVEYLKQLNRLKQVHFSSVPSKPVIAEVKAALPGVNLTINDGTPLP